MVTKDAIYDKILDVLRKELLCDGQFQPETTIETLGLDSLQMMQLFVYLEECFEFEFMEDSLIENMESASLAMLVDHVHQAVQQSSVS
jgi:acyl carrier protein